MQAVARGRRRPRRRARLRRLDRRRARRGPVPRQALARRAPARARRARPRARQAVPAARLRRERRRAPRAPRPVRAHGRGVHGGRDGHRAPARRAARQRRPRPRRARRSSRPPTRSSPAPPGLNFLGNVEGFAIGTGEADVIVTDGFTGNVVPEGDGGDGGHAAARGARRGDVLAPLQGRRAAAAPGAARAARRDRPGGPGRRVPARPAAGWAWSRTARSGPGIARAVELAARGVREDVVGRTHARLAAAGALRTPPSSSAAPATVPDP